MQLRVGQVFWYEVEYPKTGEREIRPVAILELNSDGSPVFVTFTALTHSKIKSFDGKYDKWKVPIYKGDDCGLGNNSFAKANCLAEVDASSFRKDQFIGQLHRIDIQNIKKKVQEFLDSGEDFW
ncbi:type II toxin-antitoxin system PemK/MazF family toxin [Paenibacillus sp. JSM ZJ436]|uniref:type II toxin-antitoxin system PemK/MazF family toxin n=1 Tax=Paenibacillus sp. JSM ZJ436 TaxID=3376190 RepID=UPI0037A8256F